MGKSGEAASRVPSNAEASLDRINPAGDYSRENLRVVLLGINGLRGRGSDADALQQRSAQQLAANRQLAHQLLARANGSLTNHS